MKNLIVFAISVLVLTGCTSVNLRSESQSEQSASKAREDSGAGESPLFLHLFTNADPSAPAHRIVTTRIYPSQDFGVSLGDAGYFSTNRWEGAFTNPIWADDGTPQQRPLSSIWDSGDAVLAGRIDRLNGKFFAHLQGRTRTTLCYFHGEIELEKPVYEQGCYYTDNLISPVWFALSANPDCSYFLKALEDGSLRRRDIVDRDSPLVERWLRSGQKGSTPSSTTELRGATNAIPPVR